MIWLWTYYRIFANLVRIILIESIAHEVLKLFGMKFFLGLASNILEPVQKASLKIIKTLNEFEFGKNQFDEADGSKNLSELLNSILQSI